MTSRDAEGSSFRVANVLFDDRWAGPLKRALTVGERIRSEGFETVVMIPKGESHAEAEASARRLEVVRRKFSRIPKLNSPWRLLRWALAFPRDVLMFRRLFHEQDIDVVHVNGAFFLQPAVAAVSIGKPIVWHVNDTIVPKPLSHVLGLIVRFLADEVLVAGDRAASHYGLGGHRVQKMPAPVDTDEIRPIRNGRGSSGARPVMIGIIANWIEIKGLEDFVSAIGSLERQYSGAIRAAIVGAKWKNHAEYIHRVEALIRELNLRSVIDDRGFVADIAPVLRELDILVLASRTEAFPMVVLEGMAAGLPVVATDVGAVREMLDADDANPCGVVVPSRDPEALADAMAVLAGDPILRQKLGDNGRLRACSHYSLESCVEKHRQVYRSVITSRQRGVRGRDDAASGPSGRS